MRIHTKTFHIRFTEIEYERLCKYSEKAGLPKSTYIRHMINGCRPKENPPPEFWQFKRSIYALADSIDKLANLAHKSGSIHESMLENCRAQYIQLIRVITQRMVAPDDLDIPATLKRGQLLAEKEQEVRNV